MLWVSLILSVPTHSLISPQSQPARGINELSIIVERARRAHFQHRIKIDSICKEEIKKSTQNEIEMQDKCKFSQRGRELGTRIASVEAAACVRLVANQHQAPSTEQRATSTQPKWSQTSQREPTLRQLCTGLVCIGLHLAADRSCFIPSPLVRLCVWRASLPGWLAWLGSASASAWQINSHSAIRHKLARTQGTERRAQGMGGSGSMSRLLNFTWSRAVRTSRLNTFMNGFYYFIKRHMSASSGQWESEKEHKGAKAARWRLQWKLAEWSECVCRGSWGGGDGRSLGGEETSRAQ